MTNIDDVTVTRAIVETFSQEWLDHLNVDVAIAGAGPSGLTAAYYLSRQGFKVAVFERKLSVGGGMWGGGMMFNCLVFQEEALEILDELGINYKPYREPGYYLADAVETVGVLTAKAVQAGSKVFNLMSVEDLLTGPEGICGVVLNWTSVDMAGLHVDPMSVKARYVVDATGHDCNLIKLVSEKLKGEPNTPDGKIPGEKSMWAASGEEAIVRNTGEVYPGLLVSGMAVNAVFGDHRMGPIFGGMFLSGKKIADLLQDQLKH